ncbi:membrane integrity-associated transporter subunit PqiC [Roseobacter sp. YSTF-M11]|uniref:Membrane integrity-associated transporter subunit PqiC n=1 Tax=Roseobacter insulae TaxID=2859783 RepID=A0A9X1FYF8_9RHOB|nr:ABC-type transport auxiliary lipoprotein family protein [Roseobacter insulae]MBW4709223.1 membrane integrity-associated transporter subunit PqiC [Roseobacter insulae]
MTRFPSTLAISLVVTGLLTGCTGLSTLTSATAPTDLYTLTPKSTFDPSLPRLKNQIVIGEPTATAAVSNDRIAVQPSPLQVEYLPGARWVDRAPVIVQALLLESFENSGKVDAVGRSAVSLRADYLVVTDIREFQARVPPEALENDRLQVQVRLNIKVVNADLDRIIASRSFEEIVEAQSDAAPDIAEAFDEALGDVMRDAVEWSIRSMHADARKRPATSDY